MKIEYIYILLAYVIGSLSMYFINHEDYYLMSGKIQGVSFLSCSFLALMFFSTTKSFKATTAFIPALVMSAFGGLQIAVMVTWFAIAGFV